MKPHPNGPCRVSLCVGGEERVAEALELSGSRAALRLSQPVDADASVSVTLAWHDGARTTLSASVRSVSRRRDDLHVAHVDVLGVEGDWRPFLEYLGTPPVSGAA